MWAASHASHKSCTACRSPSNMVMQRPPPPKPRPKTRNTFLLSSRTCQCAALEFCLALWTSSSLLERSADNGSHEMEATTTTMPNEQKSCSITCGEQHTEGHVSLRQVGSHVGSAGSRAAGHQSQPAAEEGAECGSEWDARWAAESGGKQGVWQEAVGRGFPTPYHHSASACWQSMLRPLCSA